jgi:hypothetical protein
MLYKNKVTILKKPEVEFEDLLRKTAELLRKEARRNGRSAAISKKRPSAA